jgi:type I restriction enzyme M protein
LTFTIARARFENVGQRSPHWPVDLDVITMPARHGTPDNPLSRVTESIRGYADASDFGAVTLTLVFLRETRRDEWARLLAAPPREAVSILNRLGQASEPPVEDNIRTICTVLPGAALTETIAAVDSVARHLGDSKTFELLLDEFAAGAKETGGVYTPRAVTTTLARILDPAPIPTVYDPYYRAGELLIAVASEVRDKFPHAPLRVYGSMPGPVAPEIAQMNMRVHAVDAQLDRRGIDGADAASWETRTFSRIVSNPPFNLSNWDQGNHRPWRYGQPPPHNANFAWLQDVPERLEPGGRAGVIMANSAASSTNRTERGIRMRMVEDGCVEGLISLPPALFPGTGVPAMIWLLTPAGTKRDELLFIDASSAGHMVNRTLRTLDDSEVQEIVQIVDDWRAGRTISDDDGPIRGGSVPLQRIRSLHFDLNPANFLTRPYTAPRAEDALPRVDGLTVELSAAQAVSAQGHSAVTQLLQDRDALHELISSASGVWPTVQLGDLCKLVPGTPTHEVLDGSVPLLKPRNLLLGRLSGPTDMLGAEEAQRLAGYQVRSGDLLCTRTGTVGRVGLATQEQDGWIFGTGLIRIRVEPESPVDPTFLSFYFTHPAVLDWIKRNSRGTSIPNISSQALATLPVRMPPLSDQRAIGMALSRLNESIDAYRRVSEATAELRDALLPLLMPA